MAGIPASNILSVYELNVDRVVSLMKAISVPPDTRVPHMTWTVSDLVAHLAILARAYVAMGQGAPSPYTSIEDAERRNDEMLAEFTERRIPVLIEQFVESSNEVIEMFSNWPEGKRWNWHGGMTLSRDAAVSVIVGELLMHGWDLAQAMELEWPISRAAATVVIGGLTEILPAAVDPVAAEGVTASYDLRLRGGPRYTIRIENGAMTIHPAEEGDQYDVHFSVDPVAFLMQGYGRGSQVLPMVQGKILIWGRRPWLAPKLMTVLQKP